MSYHFSIALQEAVFECLSGYSGLDVPVYDSPPPGSLPTTYVALGAEVVRDRSDVSGAGAEHDFTVSVITGEAGFASAKRVAGAVQAALDSAPLVLTRGTVRALYLLRARALRADKSGARRIDMTFRARIAD